MPSGELILDSYKASGHVNYNVEGKITWSFGDYGSYASVNVAIYVRKSSASTSSTEAWWPYTITIDGSSKNGSSAENVFHSWVLLGSWTKTVYSDSIEIGGRVDAPGNSVFAGDYAEGSTWIKIRDPSSPDPEPEPEPDPSTILTAQDTNFGDISRITWMPNSASYYFKLVLKCGSKTQTYSGIYPGSTNLATYNALVPYDFIFAVSSGLTGSVSVTLTTHTGSSCTSGNQVGAPSTAIIVCTIPDNDTTKPQVTAAAFAPSPNPFDGAYIQNKTGVNMTSISASGKYGASISRRYFRMEGKNYDYGTISEVIAQFGQIVLTAYAVDSRGFTSKGYTVTIEAIPYSTPKVRPIEGQFRVNAVRCDEDGVQYDKGAYLIIMAKREYSPVVYGGSQQNFCSIRYRYKPDTVSGWTDWAEILAGSETPDSITTEPLIGTLAPTSTYQVEVQAIDTLEGVGSTIVTVVSERVYDHCHGFLGSYGFGKHVELPDVFEIAVDKTFILHGGMKLEGDAYSYLLDLMHPIGSVLESVNNIDPGETLGGVWIFMETTESSTKWRRTE